MGRFVTERLVQMIVTLWLVATFVFLAVTLLPGDPVRALFGFDAVPREIYDAIVAQYHFDRPLPEQYLLFLRDLITGDLGRTFPRNAFGRNLSGSPVAAVVTGAIPESLRIIVGALTVQVVVGVSAGTLAALRRGKRSGTLVYAAALLAVSVPVLVLAYVARIYLAEKAGWFPTAGVNQGWVAYVLPSISLAALSAGYVALLARSELLDTLREPFIVAARARGFSDRRVVGIHALKNSLVPVVTLIAANVGQLMTALVVVEGVFRVPGVGGQVFFAIQSRDRALLVGLVIVIAAAVIVANTMADLLYGAIDPRVRRAGAP